MRPADRGRLRQALRSCYPWLDEPGWGPRAVEAGECGRCQAAPRLVPTCGPIAWTALCRDCAVELGTDTWCEGHRADGDAVLDAIARLPDEWPTVVLLWWVSTGEVRLDRLVATDVAELPRPVLATLGTTDD